MLTVMLTVMHLQRFGKQRRRSATSVIEPPPIRPVSGVNKLGHVSKAATKALQQVKFLLTANIWNDHFFAYNVCHMQQCSL